MDNPNTIKDSRVEAKFTSGKPRLQAQQRIFLWLSILATLLAYLPVMDNSLVSLDDYSFILFNTPIQHLNVENIKWMFTHSYVGNWIPLVWLSLAIDFWIGRFEPWVYHLDNLILHCLNTGIVFALSFKLLNHVWPSTPVLDTRGERSAAAFGAALLFGLHPLHVESVAWATERKDLLCGIFFLLSLLFYIDYAVKPSLVSKKYFAALCFFVLALLSKPMAVSLPLVFVLLDVWPLRRLRDRPINVFIEKIPFVMASFVFSAITISTQFKAGAGWATEKVPFISRALNAGHSVIYYLWKMLLPLNLYAFHPLAPEKADSFSFVFSTIAIIFISSACWIFRKKYPWVGIAWLYFLITLAPVMGLVQVGNQAFADRFTYLPSLGPFLLVSALLTSRLFRFRALPLVLAVLAAGLLGYGTFQQVRTWKNTITLWERVLQCGPENNLIVDQNLGRAYEDDGRLDEALAQYNNGIGLVYNDFIDHWGKARILAANGRLDESIQEYKIALTLNPQIPPLYSGLGMVYEKKGSSVEAFEEINQALKLNPHDEEAYSDLGHIYLDQHQWQNAVEAFQRARDLDPDDPNYLKGLISAYSQLGDFHKTLGLYQDIAKHPRSQITLGF